MFSFDRDVAFADNRVNIHERDKQLTVHFASLDYNPSALACYAYRLEGFDDKWIEVPANQHTVSYTSLRPGKYVFELRYASDGKNYVSPTQTLMIEVTPYFYKTFWFQLLVGLVLLMLVYWRFRLFKHFLKMFYMLVVERTTPLEENLKELS